MTVSPLWIYVIASLTEKKRDEGGFSHDNALQNMKYLGVAGENDSCEYFDEVSEKEDETGCVSCVYVMPKNNAKWMQEGDKSMHFWHRAANLFAAAADRSLSVCDITEGFTARWIIFL